MKVFLINTHTFYNSDKFFNLGCSQSLGLGSLPPRKYVNDCICCCCRQIVNVNLENLHILAKICCLAQKCFPFGRSFQHKYSRYKGKGDLGNYKAFIRAVHTVQSPKKTPTFLGSVLTNPRPSSLMRYIFEKKSNVSLKNGQMKPVFN